jgi:hypothetical protein
VGGQVAGPGTSVGPARSGGISFSLAPCPPMSALLRKQSWMDGVRDSGIGPVYLQCFVRPRVLSNGR